jgi:phage terminase large subunit-like protein
MGHLAPVTAWAFACPDWEERLLTGKSLIPDLPLDESEARRAVSIFDKLRLPDVPGQPLLRDAAGNWQRDIVRAIFGSLIDGVRMVGEVFCMVPKKNSKTTGGAAITLTAFLMNARPRAELIYVGPTQEVADLAFQQTVGMIEADEYLAARFHVAHHTKTILDRRNKARLKIKTFDMKVITGSKPVFVLLDELHLMATINGAARIIGQIRGGLLPNPEAVLIMITTQSDEPPAGAFKAELQYARAIRDGRVKGSVLPILYEFPEAMQKRADWREPGNWPMVLPNLGRSITIDRLVSDYSAAREKGEEEERRWASQHLNVEIGVALHSDRWIGADYWMSAADPVITIDSLIEDSDCVVFGIDGGGLDDLYGLAAIGRHKVTRDWRLWAHAWAHTDVLKLRKEIAERLRDFERDGDLTICEHPTQDVRDIADIIQRARDAGVLPEKAGVGLDPVGVSAMVDELAVRGITGEQVVAIAQGYRLSGAVWGMERKLKDGTLWHDGSPMMAWCVGNAKVEQRGNAVVITKQASGKAKIDPLVAAFDAAMLMSRNPEPQRQPTYQMVFVG